MKRQKANLAQFGFICDGMDRSAFQVAGFTGTDEISSTYMFKIGLLSKKEDIDPDEIINKQATLLIYRDGSYYPYSGVVSQFSFIDASTDYFRYSVLLVPKLSLLSMNYQTRIFQKSTVTEIIKNILDEAGFSGYAEFQTSESYPEREYVLQYQESDLNFISRLMEESGLWYFFMEEPIDEQDVKDVNSESLIITDRPSSLKFIQGDSNILYRSESGMNEKLDDQEMESIDKISYRKSIIPGTVLKKNYNYRTPEVDIKSSVPVNGGETGSVYEYGGSFKTVDEAQSSASVSAGRISSAQIQASGRSDCRGFRSGLRFRLEEHPAASLNTVYIIRRVYHTGNHSSTALKSGLKDYSNEFFAVPADKADVFKPGRKSSLPKINGIISARIEAEGSEYSALDDRGRYKVRMPFDISDAGNSSASKYIRMAQPYSGAKYGMHFPSHEGTEMLISCVDGNPDKPVGIGTVPDANTTSPVTSSNKQQSVIRTAGNNEIILDDTKDKQKIKLSTAKKNSAQFDDENQRIFLQTEKENKLILDDKNEQSALNASDHNITMDYKKGEEGITVTTGKGHIIKIDDANKKITIQTSKGHAMEMDDSAGTINISDSKGKSTVTLDENSGIILDSMGEISIKAARDVNIEGSSVNISASTGKLEAKAMQDVNISGMSINEKATTDHNIEGLNTSVKAKMNSSIDANLGVEVKSKMQTKISGTMTELSGQGITTVKGGVVMIN